MARAQPTLARIGYLGTDRSIPIGDASYRSFIDELRKLGFAAGRNLAVDFRPVDRSLDVLSQEVRALLAAHPDLLVTDGTEDALRAAVSESAVPIVMIATNFDPIERGYVKSHRAPAGT